MKKILLSATLVVAFSLTSFASESKTENVLSSSTLVSSTIFDGTCTVYVTQYNSEGIATGTRIHTLPATSQEDCEKTAKSIKTLYEIGALTM